MARSAHLLMRSAQRHVAEAATELALAVAALQSIDERPGPCPTRLGLLISAMTSHKHLIAHYGALVGQVEDWGEPELVPPIG